MSTWRSKLALKENQSNVWCESILSFLNESHRKSESWNLEALGLKLLLFEIIWLYDAQWWTQNRHRSLGVTHKSNANDNEVSFRNINICDLSLHQWITRISIHSQAITPTIGRSVHLTIVGAQLKSSAFTCWLGTINPPPVRSNIGVWNLAPNVFDGTTRVCNSIFPHSTPQPSGRPISKPVCSCCWYALE